MSVCAGGKRHLCLHSQLQVIAIKSASLSCCEVESLSLSASTASDCLERSGFIQASFSFLFSRIL